MSQALQDVAIWHLPGKPIPDGERVAFVLLAPPGAEPCPAAVARARTRLESSPALAAVLDLEPSGEAASPELELCVWPEHVGAVLLRTDLLRALPLGDDFTTPIARAWIALAAAVTAPVGASAEPLCKGGVAAGATPESLASYCAFAVRSFAMEDLYPVLRRPGGSVQIVPSLYDWASRLLQRQVYGAGFALGDYAASLAEHRNEGSELSLRVPCASKPPASAPEVTIVVPTCERPRLLARTLASLAEQTVQDFEVIVVNDGGGAQAVPSLDVLAPGLAGRLTVVHHALRRGPSAARNTGLRLARGRYVCFLDDDDRLLPHHLASLLPALRRGARVVHSDTRSVTETAIGSGPPRTVAIDLLYQMSYDPLSFQLDNFVPIHSVLAERQLLLDCGGFDESLPVLEDWDLWLRVFAVAPPLRVPRVTCEVRTRDDGGRLTSSRASRWPEALVRIYAKTLERERAHPALRPARLKHLLKLCRERDVPVPRDATWLAGGEGLAAIDPSLGNES